MKKKWLVSLLAVAMMLTMMPNVVYAQDTDSLGTIEKITEAGTVDGDTITVDSSELNWYAKDTSVGRYQDGWWIGVKVIAPKSVIENNVNNVKYSNDGTDNLIKNFGSNKDGIIDGRYYMGCWLPITVETMDDFLAAKQNMKWTYKFDWDGDGAVDQTFTIVVNPNDLTLNKDSKVWYKTENGLTVIRDGKDVLADYSKVDAAITEAKALDKNNYKDFAAVEEAITAVVRDKKITEQSAVDDMAVAIKKAISALKYKDADYSKVDEAIASAPSDLSIYTDETVKALNDAIDAVVRDKRITDQAVVDGYAKAIEQAILKLEKKSLEAIVKVDAPTIDTTEPVKEVTVGVQLDSETESMLKNSMSEELKELVNHTTQGVTVTVDINKIDITNISEDVQKDIAKTEEILKNQGLKVALYLDINIVVNVDDGVLGNITKTDRPLTLQVAIPEELKEEGRTFKVIRVHEGVVTVLDTEIKDGMLIFKTDSFSTYSLTYSDATTSTNPTVDTADSTSMTAFYGLLALSLAGMYIFSRKKKYN